MGYHGTYKKPIFLCPFILLLHNIHKDVEGLACKWETQASHLLPPNIVVKLLSDSGCNKVKLLEPDHGTLKALGKSGIQVMVGIHNDLLPNMASTITAAELWIQLNDSHYISKYGTDIRYVVVGNDPIWYNDRFIGTTFPALKNVKAALVKAGLGTQVKATLPFNDDPVFSGGILTEIKTLMGFTRLLPIKAVVITILRWIIYWILRYGSRSRYESVSCEVCLEDMENEDEVIELRNGSHVFYQKCI